MSRWWDGVQRLLWPRTSDRSVRGRVGAEVLGRVDRVRHDRDLTTSRVAAEAYLATNTMGRLLRRSRRERAGLRAALLDAVDAVLAARLALAALTGVPGRQELAEAAGEVARARLAGPPGWRDLRLPRWLHRAVVAVTFVVDVSFFYTLYVDLWALSRSELLSIGRLGAVATALLTPLVVVATAETAGRWLAHRRYPAAADAGRVPLGPAGPACLAAVPVLSAVFYGVAWFRFSSESSGFGGATAPVWLLALVFALLPLTALLTVTASTDPGLEQEERVLREHGRARKAEQAALAAVRTAQLRHRRAWLDLAVAVVRVVDRGNLAIQHWEHLVLAAYADTGRAGDAAPLREEVLAAGSTADVDATLDTGADPVRARYVPLPLLTQLRATLFACPPWVLRELLVDQQVLASSRPPASTDEDRATRELLALLQEATAAVGGDGDGADREDPEPPHLT
ncbi:hypothetical protein ACWKWC_04840, partial [Geodermatophilus nigrescens]